MPSCRTDTTGERGCEEVHDVVVEPRESSPSHRRAPASVNPPFAGLIAHGTVEAALHYTADQRVHQHSSETYQGSNEEEERSASGERTGAGHDQRTTHGPCGSHQRHPSTGTCRDHPARPEQSGRHPAAYA